MRSVGRLAIVAMLAFGLLAVAPGPASAQEVDGCTAVPDSGPAFDFTDACLQHDRCYIDQPYGSSPADRRQCDQELRDDMIERCAELWPDRSQRVNRTVCRGVALVYYLGVRVFGGFFWDSADPGTPLAV